MIKYSQQKSKLTSKKNEENISFHFEVSSGDKLFLFFGKISMSKKPFDNQKCSDPKKKRNIQFEETIISL